MRTIFTITLAAVLLCAASAFGQNQKTPSAPALSVVEERIQIFYRADDLQVLLPVRNDSGGAQEVSLRLDVLSASDLTVARAEAARTLERGDSAILLKVPFAQSRQVGALLWHRLRYVLTSGGVSRSGTVSFSETMPELFRIRATTGSDRFYPGMTRVVRVRTVHPVSGRSVRGVLLEGELEIDVIRDGRAGELKIGASAETDENGRAVLRFAVPDDTRVSPGESSQAILRIKGDKEGILNSAFDSLDSLAGYTTVRLNTDKPLYQPGQMLRVRGLALQGEFADSARKAAADRELEFRISDEEDTTLYREKVRTSRFGIASIEWQVPENARLGRYVIEVSDGEGFENLVGSSRFRVSRYELPNFFVKTETDRDFYLPDEKEAEVTVEADYLFGKKVAGGKVRIVRESERTWNYQEQKWDIAEEETYEGETDEDGRFKQKIDLSEAHEELAGDTEDQGFPTYYTEDSDSKFRDLSFTAYYTDTTTNITEQRRFDIRVTREPLHVYVSGIPSEDQNPRLPVEFFVSVSAADGSPVADAEVRIEGRYEYDDDETFRTVEKVRTNRYGAAKVAFRAPKCPDGECDDTLELRFTARDREGRAGTLLSDTLDIDGDEKQVRVSTDRTIYAKGRPVRLEISSSENDETVFVDVMRNFSSLSSHQVRLRKGRAKLTIPYEEGFRGELMVTAYLDDDGDAVADSKGIIYPAPRNLRLDLGTDAETYRPAGEATLDLRVDAPGGGPSGENAIGLFILDRAVEERALTDSNFGGGFDTFADLRSLLGATRRFGGVTLRDLEELDLSKEVPDDLQLAAEVMLDNPYFEPDSFSSHLQESPRNVFAPRLQKQMKPIIDALLAVHKEDSEHPVDAESFRRILARRNIDFDALRDPWGNPYRVYVYIEGGRDVVYVWSDGPDKRYQREQPHLAPDDFVALTLGFSYFQPTGQKIDEAVAEYTGRTGKFVRDRETLREALLEKDIDIDQLRDRWGRPYVIEFGARGRFYMITFRSHGPNGEPGKYGDDFTIWTTQTDYFAEHEERIRTILSERAAAKKPYPKTPEEFVAALREGGLVFEDLRDGWGNPPYIETSVFERFADRVTVENVVGADKEGEARQRYVITPVTQQVARFRVRSHGANGPAEEYDWRRPLLAEFMGVISEQKVEDAKPKEVVPKLIFIKGEGAVIGTIKDPTGAIIPGVDLVLRNRATDAEQTAQTNEEGVYLFEKVPAGSYDLRATAPGFQTTVVLGVPVTEKNIAQVNITLDVGSVSAVVEVAASGDAVVDTTDSAVTVDVTDTRIDTSVTSSVIEALPMNGRNFGSLLRISGGVLGTMNGGLQIDGASGTENVFIVDGQEATDFATGMVREITQPGEGPAATPGQRKETPRLRNYFPETLLWNPEIVTDENGRATVRFKLADSITTWKIYAIASNLEGRIGVAEKEIKAFQPFFVDLLPPRVLTEGDEIRLPVQVRNYTGETREVDVEMTQADWFTFLGGGGTDTTNGFADVSNNSRGDDGSADTPAVRRQRIEVPANATRNAVFGFRAGRIVDEGYQKVTAYAGDQSDAVEKPVTVRPDGREIVRTESLIFDRGTVFEADFPANALQDTREAELKLYPNLFAHVTESVTGLLKRPYGCAEQTISSTYPNLLILKMTKEDHPLRPLAQKYLQKGYERMLGYQANGGGFAYWGGSEEANLALTAYALRFLSDARGHAAIDEDVIHQARLFLVRKQNEDGSWTQTYHGETEADRRRTWQITTYVTRSLAMTERNRPDGEKTDETVLEALGKAFAYLEKRNAEIDEPYALANYGLALLDVGRAEEAARVAARLAEMAVREKDSVYWKLETNTPFYGWGTAGRLETSALVVQLLTRVEGLGAADASMKEKRTKGTIFLLRNKDRYGVWYSTQTTVNVLDAFIAAIEADGMKGTVEKPSAGIYVNGRKMKDVELPPADEPGFPIVLRLDPSVLDPQRNRVEVRTDGAPVMMAQFVRTHYVPWADEPADADADVSRSRQIRLDYTCDRYNAEPASEIKCRVKAERVGFRGYGMLLAEIGLPPGADVDRASLERAKKDNWSFSRYDVLPDRIIVYMWAQAGGTEFDFSFRPRYGIDAQTPSSILYDYYNEEAKAVLAPKRFVVD